MTTTGDILNERKNTHGDFEKGAQDFAQLMRPVVEKWLAGAISNVNFYGLTMANAKQVRILNGDSSHADHYIDAANYFTLAGGLYKASNNETKYAMKTASHCADGVRMNEINVSIPYSLFKCIFYCFVSKHLKTTCGTAKFAIRTVKEYWILLDGESREDIVSLCKSPNNAKLALQEIQNFEEWAIKNRNAKRDCNISRQLVDVLPVVNLGKQ